MQQVPTAKGLPFLKAHGIGNDYVVCAAGDLMDRDVAALARLLCAAHTGVGADGLLGVGAHAKADFEMRMWNPDGSEAEMCGNGLRCAARAAQHLGILPTDLAGPVIAATGAGLLPVTIHPAQGNAPAEVSVEMGAPVFGALLEAHLEGVPEAFAFTEVSMGNPHAVTFIDDPEQIDLPRIGALVEHHAHFPDRTNVEFVAVTDRNTLVQRTWERGAGETLACGTGACAVLAAAVKTGRSERQVRIHLRGGALDLSWPEDGPITMRGPAVLLYSGRWEPS